MERLIAATKAMFNHVYSGQYNLRYTEVPDPEYVRNIDSVNNKVVIEARVIDDVRGLHHGCIKVYLLVYEPAKRHEKIVLEVNINYSLYELGVIAKTVTIPDPLDIFRKIFDGLDTSEDSEYNTLQVAQYKEPTDIMDTILSSTPEELELYLKLL